MSDDSNEDEEEFDDSSSDEEALDGVGTGRDCLKILADKIRRRQVSRFHLSPEIQMLMDLYLRLVGRGASLSTFDDVLEWAKNHSLIDSHLPTRKPLINQISTAVQHRVHLCTGSG